MITFLRIVASNDFNYTEANREESYYGCHVLFGFYSINLSGAA